MSALNEKLDRVAKRYDEIAALLASEGPKDAQSFAKLSKEYSDLSPVVYTPQRGKAVTKQYLEAASQTLVGGAGGAFHYTKQVLSGDTAVLEFETSVDGKYVNGVDIIRCDDAGRIVEFRVMMRPLQGIQAVHEQMGRRLAAGS